MQTLVSRRVVMVLVALITLGTIPAIGAGTDRVTAWNATAIRALLIAGQSGVASSRSMAIAQVAVHDALNAIDRRYDSYADDGPIDVLASPDAAIATAAHDALAGLIQVGPLPFTGFGSVAQQAAAVAFIDAVYAADLATIADAPAKTRGISVGHRAAFAILAKRGGDGAMNFVPYTPGTNPGDWQPTPNPAPFDPPAAADRLPAVLPGWGNVTTFVLRSSDQFGAEGPAALGSRRYARDYNEVKAIGDKRSTVRSADQEHTARFWYEGSPAGWSRIAATAAALRGLDAWDTARLLALVNLAMADGFIAGMADKYTFNFWRPVTAIRAGDLDGNPATVEDRAWDSLLNSPAIPDYPSTHSVLGAAAAEVLRRVLHDDNVAFTVTSGAPFAGLTRSFTSFSQAAEENGNSRVLAGIHFRSAVRDGLKQGRSIGRFVASHALRPLDRDEDERNDR